MKKIRLIQRKALITVDAIPHNRQRYPTWGDWKTNLSTRQLAVKMSSLSDWRYLYLGAIHEIVEATVCMHKKITQNMVDKFDFDYEARRVMGKERTMCGCPITNDPGSDVHAPYFDAHEFAEEVEYKLAKLLDVDRKVYNAACVAETEPFEKVKERKSGGRRHKGN